MISLILFDFILEQLFSVEIIFGHFIHISKANQIPVRHIHAMSQ